MCSVSMIMDHFYDKWRKYEPLHQPTPPSVLLPVVPSITPEEILEFRKLLDRAREYDRQHGQPDCGLDEKRQRLKDLAKELGVEIEFV